MDDLISREAALEAVKIPNGEYPNPSERHGIIIARVEARRRIMEIPSVPAVPLDKLCVLLKELNESGYSFQCAFCKKAFPAWCGEKNKDIGWDRELHCPTWEEITEWMVKLDAN